MVSNCDLEDNQGRINTDKFSSPMPTIGVYIAIASGACLVFMVVDIISGFRHKKRWIPCKLFSLNSLTLTLIAIATKLPTDLTTPMLSYLGQFSKLTGILFMNTSMNFFLPSLGSATPSQNLSNMISFSILVITIIVDSFIQFFTGAIQFHYLFFLFVLFLLLSSLVDLWISALEINNDKIITSDPNWENLRNGTGSMICRLRCCYVRRYITNPQLLLCLNQLGPGGVSSILTFPILLFQLSSAWLSSAWDVGCKEKSDYKWSIYLVFATQLITILVSIIASLFRCLVRGNQIVLHISVNFLLTTVESLQLMHMNNHKTAYQHLICAATRILVTILSIRLKTILLVLRVVTAFVAFIKCSVPESFDEQQKNATKWIEKKGEQDVDTFIDLYRKDSPSHLIQFLSETPPSDEQQLQDFHVSCLSAVLLVRMASDAFPSHPHIHSLIHAFDEAFPIILFIGKNTSPTTFENNKKLNFAEKAWKLWDFKSPLKRSDIGKVTNFIQSTTGLRTTQRESYFNFIQKEISLTENTIHSLRFSPVNDPCIGIKRVLVDMLHEILAKFPIAVFRYVTEATTEEAEDRIKLAINFLCRLELLEDKILWEFPSETNITSLITTHPPFPSDYENNNHGSS